MWVEKYRPEKIDNIVSQEAFTSLAKVWVIEPESMPHLLFYGQAGVGKTSAALALSREILGDGFNSNFLELNASNDRRLETVRMTIGGFASTNSLGDIPYKICLLDEIDGMTKSAQEALKRIMEKYHNNVRFILTCNKRSKIIDPIASRCKSILFNPITLEDGEHLVKGVLMAEGLTVDTTFLIQHLETYGGDIRKALNGLETLFKKGALLPIMDNKREYSELLYALDSGDVNAAHDDVLALLKGGSTIEEMCDSMHDEIISSRKFNNSKKYNYLRIIGETQYRGMAMTPRVLASWMIAQIKQMKQKEK
jgi:replication factor C small subunit